MDKITVKDLEVWGSFPFDKKSRRGKYLELN